MGGHPGEEDLERYLIEKSGPEQAEEIEEHLLVCEKCLLHAEKIDSFVSAFRAVAPQTIRTLQYRHDTEAGVADLLVIRTSSRWMARIWAPAVEFQHDCESLPEAFESARSAFRQMFPEHRCGPGCGPPEEGRES